MANKLNEFSLNLPIVSPETYGDTSQEGNFEEPEYQDQQNQTLQVSMGPEVNPEDSLSMDDYESQSDNFGRINIAASSITAVDSFNSKDQSTCFDITFSVTIYHDDGDSNTCGTYSSHQVVKRISIDKLKMEKEAKQASLKVSVVEGKNKSDKKVIITEAKRFRILAGLE